MHTYKINLWTVSKYLCKCAAPVWGGQSIKPKNTDNLLSLHLYTNSPYISKPASGRMKSL